MLKNIQMPRLNPILISNINKPPNNYCSALNSSLKADTFSFSSNKTINPINKVQFFEVRDDETDYLSNAKPNIKGCEKFEFSKSSLNDFIDKNPGKIFKGVNAISVISKSSVSKDSDLKKVFPDLKMIIVRAAGHEKIEKNYCNENDIIVANASGYAKHAVAEYTIGMLLNLDRKISQASSDFKTGTTDLTKYKGINLSGKTLGIIGGTGDIGSQVAKIAAGGFGMKVIILSRNAEKDFKGRSELKKTGNVKFTSDQNELLANSDILSLNCDLNNGTKHLINEKTIAEMKLGVLIINTARGGVVDTQALFSSLKTGKVGGFASDVIEEEEKDPQAYLLKPLNEKEPKTLNIMLLNDELTKLPNVLITKHTAYNTQEAVTMRLDDTLNNIKAYISGNIENMKRVDI